MWRKAAMVPIGPIEREQRDRTVPLDQEVRHAASSHAAWWRGNRARRSDVGRRAVAAPSRAG
jgi:hypothetical protein